MTECGGVATRKAGEHAGVAAHPVGRHLPQEDAGLLGTHDLRQRANRFQDGQGLRVARRSL